MTAATSATPSVTIESFETDLAALLTVAKGDLETKKKEIKAARARVRQIARQHRIKHCHKTISAVADVVPRALFYSLAFAGCTAFGLGLVFLAIGNGPVAVALFTVTGAAWGMGAVARQ
ncbi:hypothetical protein [Streptomyces niveus]|uniref:hypothetical protein n=1 Tax=Streptomyces niveus TaxID=193462 RepID=UPI0036D25E28